MCFGNIGITWEGLYRIPPWDKFRTFPPFCSKSWKRRNLIPVPSCVRRCTMNLYLKQNGSKIACIHLNYIVLEPWYVGSVGRNILMVSTNRYNSFVGLLDLLPANIFQFIGRLFPPWKWHKWQWPWMMPSFCIMLTIMVHCCMMDEGMQPPPIIRTSSSHNTQSKPSLKSGMLPSGYRSVLF